MAIERIKVELVVSIDNQKTAAFDIPGWAKHATVLVPSIVDGVVEMEMIDADSVTLAAIAPDQDTNWHTVYNDKGQSVVLWPGVDPAYVDISRWIQGIHEKNAVRFSCVTVQTSDVTFILYVKG